MSVYLAGTSSEPHVVEAISAAIAAHGIPTLHAWTKQENLMYKTPMEIWMQCFAQINRADAIVIIQPTVEVYKLRGALLELGYAIGKGKPAYLFFPHGQHDGGDWHHSPGIVGSYTIIAKLIQALEPFK